MVTRRSLSPYGEQWWEPVGELIHASVSVVLETSPWPQGEIHMEIAPTPYANKSTQ